jgi:hypothetical protein
VKAILRRLPLVRELLSLRDATVSLDRRLANMQVQQAEAYVAQVLAGERYRDPRRLNRFEAQVFSQSGEDGILGEIFRRIGSTERSFVEIGVGNGLENNTAYLLAQGWRGRWLDGDRVALGEARRHFQGPIAEGRLVVRESVVTAENVAGLLDELDVPREGDLLSIDVDRNTYYIWRALRERRPRVVVVEYNATFPPSDEWVVAYDPVKGWNSSSYFGASLKSYELLGRELGYRLVGCGLAGTNAFFVRDDLEADRFEPPFTAEHHYEPPRYWLARLRFGHRRCFTD